MIGDSSNYTNGSLGERDIPSNVSSRRSLHVFGEVHAPSPAFPAMSQARREIESGREVKTTPLPPVAKTERLFVRNLEKSSPVC